MARLCEVIHHRDDGENERYDHGEPRKHVERVIEGVRAGHGEDGVLHDKQYDRDDLCDGLRLAIPACRDDDALVRGDHADARHDELARQDDEHRPRRQDPELNQREKRCTDENLVRKRVHELAEVRHLATAAREVAIKPIRT